VTILVFIGSLLGLMALGMPVAFALIGCGIAMMFYMGVTDPQIVIQNMWDGANSFPLLAVPFFMLAGEFMNAGGMTRRIIQMAMSWIGHIRGGLGYVAVVAAVIMASLSGSAVADTAALAAVLVPMMRNAGYNINRSCGLIACGGIIAPVIPPSIAMILYGVTGGVSITKLFIAGIVPGALLSLLFIATVALLCARNPKLGPPGPATTVAQKVKATRGIVEAVLLFVLAIGGLMLGWFSPTQAGAIGAGGALAIGLARRKLSWKGFVDAGREGLGTSCMVLFIIAGAIVFGHFMAVSKIPFALADWVGELPLHRMAIMAVIIVIYFIGGFFMDSMALIVVTLPIFYPVVRKLGFDPIWFGVMIVLLCEMGVITPPVGVNVFVIKSIVPDVPLHRIFRGIFPFLGAILLLAGVLVFVPGIATFLPGLVK
jgi:tripartite ATP-independent transporter DctM subunit